MDTSTLGEVQTMVDVDGALLAVHVLDLGLACCGVEVMAALHEGSPADARVLLGADGAADAHVLLVSGTITDVLAGAVRAAYEALPTPRYVVSIGACCATGGPYWDSYSVTKGVDQLVPVHVSVPGCPPRPEAVLGGLRALAPMLSTP
ncbi:MAG: NADH-quinone oxidoreductase subunit NuoB [Mycobacteriaceae bacterium]